jgi:energy-coupling factor transporter ATP-binding protein EcfA2
MTIEAEILVWAASRPLWQQVVLHELARGHVFSQPEIDTVAADLRAGKQPIGPGLQPNDIPGAQPAGGAVALRSVRDLANVNALLDAQELTFGAKGLTVIYGDNGSGKSGYARLIKDVSGARHHAPVHTNVFAHAVGNVQQAVIGFISGGVDGTSTWPAAVSADLRAVRFYDEACGDAYIVADSELTYRPSALALLDGLIGVCDAVGAVLAEQLRNNQLARGTLPTLTPATGAAKFLSTLSATTTDGELDAACALAADAPQRLGVITQEEARLRATDPAKERTRLETLAGKLEQVSRHLDGLDAALGDVEAARTFDLRDRALALRAAATMASEQSFEGEPVDGVGSQTWRTLWEAARRFSLTESYPDRDFPATDDASCLLCHQALSAPAADRLLRFEAFMRDTTAQQADEAEAAARHASDVLRAQEPTPAPIAAALVEIEAAEPALAEVATSWLEAAAARLEALLSRLGDGDPVEGVAPLDPPVGTALATRARELQAQAAAIDATAFRAALDALTAEKIDIETRGTLHDHRSDIVAEINRLADRQALESARRLTDTGAITRKSTELTEAHVTALVRDRFTRESDRLRLERIELQKTGGQKGRFRHKPALLGAKAPQPVDEVLSEGEQTALGLAGFFTESHFDDSKSALVLDDPVTSLDHIRRAHVAKRLGQLAADRQVIVFTHDVAFVGNLRQAADEEQVAFTERGVQRRGDRSPGLCTDQHPWKVKDVPRRLDALGTGLARIRRERTEWDQDTYEKECADWAGRLSETWERMINLEIVNTVVDPATQQVRPMMFKVLARITDDDNRAFQQSYGRVSGWARRHDKSPTTNYVAPEPDELDAELKAVREWFDRVRKYSNN